MKRTTLLVAFIVLATAALAHRDAKLSVGPDGVILGLPLEYKWTRLRVAFAGGEAGALRQLAFMSSGRETSVQPCLLRLVPNGSFDHVFLTGSWYHNELHLPHYVEVEFRDSPSQPGLLPYYPGVLFLFSLRDASLLKVTQVIAHPRDGTVQFWDIRSSNTCPE